MEITIKKEEGLFFYPYVVRVNGIACASCKTKDEAERHRDVLLKEFEEEEEENDERCSDCPIYAHGCKVCRDYF